MADNQQQTTDTDTGSDGQDAAAAAADQQATDTGKDTAADAKKSNGADAKPATVFDADADADKGKGNGADKATTMPSYSDFIQELAGDDKDVLNTLSRYTDFKSALKALPEARKQIAKGKQPLERPADDAGDEAWAEYREALGIPPEPGKYELKLKDGRTLGDEDKPIFEEFAKVAHASDMTNAQISQVMDWYYDLTESEASELLDIDQDHRAETINALKEEWGPEEFKVNKAAIDNMTAGWPEGMGDQILGARMPNGYIVGGDAEAVRVLASMAREMYPGGTQIVDGDGQLQSVQATIDEIEKVMRDKPQEYWKDEPMQKRLEKAYAQRLKIEERSKKTA